MKTLLIRRIARRCATHDTASTYKIRALEAECGMPLSPARDFVDQLANPDLIDCGHTWCGRGRP
ncbi:hypothetical protein ACF1BS_04205 [Streptomyces sp. NPDC014748]|uniref:hypothetical protein n=1 Tax=Streptomyces sp. NPDC014748 TaxID=3364905 RepID=UPI0036FEB3E8